MKPYRVALIQQETRVIVDMSKRDEIIDANLSRIFELIDWTFLRLGGVKLAMFSEYGIIGQYRPRSVDEWLSIAETIPGPVTDRIGAKADHPMAVLFASAMREWRRSDAKGLTRAGLSASVRDRVGQVMRLNISREMDGLERYLGVLATVGSTAPFIGLLGTVWGIMNSFQAIAASKNTSLAVVAPGIAEALFATALGLVAAIPAVVAYNKFSTDLGRFGNRLEGFSSEFTAILSRQLDERGH